DTISLAHPAPGTAPSFPLPPRASAQPVRRALHQLLPRANTEIPTRKRQHLAEGRIPGLIPIGSSAAHEDVEEDQAAYGKHSQQSNTDQQMSLRNRWSSSTSSRIASGSWSRCHRHSSRPALSPSSGAAARAALIAY